MLKSVEMVTRIIKDVEENPSIKLCMPKAEVEALEQFQKAFKDALFTQPFAYKPYKKEALVAPQKLAANFDFTYDVPKGIEEFVDSSILFVTSRKSVAAKISKKVRHPGKISVILSLSNRNHAAISKQAIPTIVKGAVNF